ncbi:hypothetical protein EYF80_025440 [Liparis tanakae]|uniref:Uncharacterized protein n=1 Tax=Liparis tanakae TaxID=230148 RepID=A0A4Z2HFK7_9TELE|nr:hypothetical protein EYF80_025440 [Liparis tanakae]
MIRLLAISLSMKPGMRDVALRDTNTLLLINVQRLSSRDFLFAPLRDAYRQNDMPRLNGSLRLPGALPAARIDQLLILLFLYSSISPSRYPVPDRLARFIHSNNDVVDARQVVVELLTLHCCFQSTGQLSLPVG